MAPEAAIRVRYKLVEKLKRSLLRPIHSVLLSNSEEVEIDFIRKGMCKPLSGNDMRRLRVRKQT
jgi:hypothetical protein